jgi:hypothetical protein
VFPSVFHIYITVQGYADNNNGNIIIFISVQASMWNLESNVSDAEISITYAYAGADPTKAVKK